jgi:hypothetical protein
MAPCGGGRGSATASAEAPASVSGNAAAAWTIRCLGGRGQRVDERGVSVGTAHGTAPVWQDGGTLESVATLCARDDSAG